jgi:general secretion pathway protein D
LSTVLGGQSRTDQTTTTTATPMTSSLQAPLSAAPLPSLPNTTTTQASTSFGTGDDEVRVGVDKESNTLLIVASPARWIQIQRILNEVDRPPRQVLIEASILEVTLGKQFQFGVDWSVVANDVAVGSINNGAGTIGPHFPGLSVTYLTKDVKAAISALGSKTDVEVVSAPKIIALDNHTARLQVGDQVPVVTQSAQSTSAAGAPLVSSVDYRSTGVILTVTPRISGDDQLVLDVNQEVSSVSKTSTSSIDSPTIQQRRFESALMLHSGGVVALGGLISATRSVSNSGVPFLKDIPAVGALFRTSGNTNDRSELIVLLTAKIITDQAAGDRAMGDLLADMHELQSRGLLPHKR